MTDFSIKQGQVASSGASECFFAPRRLAHINYWVEDVERVAEFYRDVAGFREAYRRPRILGVFMSNGNTYHDLAFMDISSPIGKEKSAGLHHFAFELENEVVMIEGYEKAQGAGYHFDYTMSADVAHSVYGSDPDGNGYEVYADVYPDWRNRRQGTIEGVKPGWKPRDTPPVAESCYPVDPEIDCVETAVFHPRRTARVTLVARDFEGMYRHYTDLVGLTPLAGGLKERFAVLGGTLREPSLTLFRATDQREVGVHHVGFELATEDEFEVGMRRLRERGIRPELEIDHPFRRAVLLKDPCGARIQFFVDRSREHQQLGGIEEGVALFLS